MPSDRAIVSRSPSTACVASYTVSCSPSQTASVACGSIGLWCCIGVVYTASMRAGAAASAAATSPSCESGLPLLNFFGTVADAFSASKSSIGGRAS